MTLRTFDVCTLQVLHVEREEEPFDLIGASFGASNAHHVAIAAQQIGANPERLILIDPNPAPPYVREFYDHEPIGRRMATFNCVFGVFDGSDNALLEKVCTHAIHVI